MRRWPWFLRVLLGAVVGYALYRLGLGCCMILEGGHLLFFDQGVEYVLVDGRRVELETVEDEHLYNLKTTGGRFRIAYRYRGGREQVVDIDPSVGDESPSMSFHRDSVRGTFPYRRIR